MVTKHLTDTEIQLFAFDRANCEVRVAEHIHVCSACKSKVETYQVLIQSVTQASRPSFDFDLSAAVLNQLPVAQHKTSGDKLLTWIFILISVGLMGGVFYFFRSYLDSMFKGVSSISIYLMGVSAITVIAWMFVEMYKKYQKEIRILDLY